MSVHPLIWAGFVLFVLAMLSLDLFVFHRGTREPSTKEAATWVGVWVALGVGFVGVIWAWQGGTAAGEYMAGYLLEYALSVDNIFVFVLIFSYFAVPASQQRGVLFWGILGALVFRAAFIVAGAALLDQFHFMFYVFGAFLVITGIRMARHGDVEVHPDRNPVLRAVRRVIPMTDSYRDGKFFVRENGARLATPLFAVLIVVETTDIVFAVDSIPAIFGVTRRPFLVFTSNAFAILGLRSLYFLLAGMMRRFQYLQVGLSAVLVFIGVKMILSDVFHIPVWASLAFIVAALAVAVTISLRVESRDTSPVSDPQDGASATPSEEDAQGSE